MSNPQEITALQTTFGKKDRFTTSELVGFIKKDWSQTSAKAIHWKIHTLKENGFISSLGRGVYQWKRHEKQSKVEFEGRVPAKLEALYSKIQSQFPLIQICIWPVRWIHEFMTHLPSVNWTIVEVDKDVSESVFALLRQSRHDVFLNPDRQTMEHQLAYDRKAIIVKDLVSQAPLIHTKGMNCPTIEKVLVDLFVDKVIFDVYQGSEIENIFSEVRRKHQLNLSRMKRYASRRRVWQGVSEMLDKTMDVNR